MWSISKDKWLKGPEFPHKRGVEEGCATLLNRSVVLVIGITKLESKYKLIIFLLKEQFMCKKFWDEGSKGGGNKY